MTEEEKKTITREKHSGRVAQGHKLAALMKKRKEEILYNKEQSTEQSTVQSKEQSKEQSSVQSTEQSTVQPTEQSNNTYVYGVGILAVLAIVIAVCVFFTLFSLKNSSMIAWRHHQKDVICFRKIYTINELSLSL